MRRMHVAELKDRLSFYLSAVQAGQEILVRKRDKPIARIVPIRPADDPDAEEERLVAAGKLRLGTGRISFWSLPAPRVTLKKVLAAVAAERRED